jgi:chaperonin GroES
MPKSKKTKNQKSKSKNLKAKMSSPMFKIQPLQDRVIIKEDNESIERTTATGIIIPMTVSDDKGSKRGKVIATGPGRSEDGKIIPVGVKPGNIVLFQWGDKIKVDDEEYYLVRESEILAVVK